MDARSNIHLRDSSTARYPWFSKRKLVRESVMRRIGSPLYIHHWERGRKAGWSWIFNARAHGSRALGGMATYVSSKGGSTRIHERQHISTACNKLWCNRRVWVKGESCMADFHAHARNNKPRYTGNLLLVQGHAWSWLIFKLSSQLTRSSISTKFCKNIL